MSILLPTLIGAALFAGLLLFIWIISLFVAPDEFLASVLLILSALAMCYLAGKFIQVVFLGGSL